jgi:hypothetical protein
MFMDATGSNVYGRALAAAYTELNALNVEFDKLAARKAKLEAFIANTEPLVPEDSPSLPFAMEKVHPPPTKLLSQPIWKSIIYSINGKGDSFSVRDALDALARIGKPVQSPNNFQIVRAVLKKKTDNFEQISPGLFRVKKAEREKEVIPEETTS